MSENLAIYQQASGKMLVVPQVDMSAQLTLAKTLLADLTSFAITTQADADVIGQELAKSKNLARELEAMRTQIKEPFLETGRAIDAHFQPILKTHLQIKTVCDGALVQWARQQAEIARQEQAKRDAEAAIEREKLRKQAEQQAEAARQAEQQAEAVFGEEARALAERAQGAREAASALIEQSQMTVSAPVTLAKTAASTVSDKWQVDVFDEAAAIKYAASRPELHYLLSFNSSRALAQAKLQKENFQIDGVRAYNQGSVRSNLASAA